jgi:hypothetical protein
MSIIGYVVVTSPEGEEWGRFQIEPDDLLTPSIMGGMVNEKIPQEALAKAAAEEGYTE